MPAAPLMQLRFGLWSAVSLIWSFAFMVAKLTECYASVFARLFPSYMVCSAPFFFPSISLTHSNNFLFCVSADGPLRTEVELYVRCLQLQAPHLSGRALLLYPAALAFPD